MNLERFENNDLELLIDINDGSVFGSQSAIARMCERAESTIRYYLRSAGIETKEVQIPSGKDSRPRHAQLVDEEGIHKCLEKYKPDLLVQCSKLGLRMYLYRLAGYKFEVKDKQSELVSLKQDMKVLMSSVAELHNKLDSSQQQIAYLTPIAEKYERFSGSFELLEDLQPLLEKIADELKENPDQEYKPLSKWLKELNFPNAGRGHSIALGKLLTSFMKIGNLNHYLKSKGNSKYPEAFKPLIKECYFFTLRN